MKSNVKENIGYIAIALVVALTLVLSVVSLDAYHDNDITAFAYAPSDNSIYVYPDSVSILPEDYNYLSHYAINGEWLGYNLKDNTLYEVIMYYDGTGADLPSLYFYGFFVLLDGWTYVGLYDNGYADAYFSLEVINEGFMYFDSPTGYFEDLDSFFVYDIREVTSSSSDIPSSFLSLIGDGITFGFESIADGVSYTMDNLFIVDGELTNFSTVLFLTLGIGLALAIVKFVLRFIFSLGGKF